MGKKLDVAKQEAKKARQALKQQKADTKRNKKELKEAGELDIEVIIAEYKAKENAKQAVSVSPCEQPSRRANFSMTALPNGEVLMFGGEYCDGESTNVFNDVFRWNIDKNEWKLVESLNTPPPRCSHQMVLYNEKVFMFGGEYATMDQFHHYRDFWEFDLKTNSWSEVTCTGDLPSARSGHRMVVWRNYLILFGGFYEAMREVRWYNDLYLYSFQERRWTLVPNKSYSQVPKPRSGVQMFLHAGEDILYIFGGYSKQKEGSKQEGRIHEDMWMLHLKPGLSSTKSSHLDVDKLVWQKCSRKGDYPSPRCGAVAIAYKNKALVFGGVFDSEGPRHSLVSVFYDDLFAFDMDRKRWYKLGLKQFKPKEERSRKQKNKLCELNEDSKEFDDLLEEDEEENCNSVEVGEGELFGYIDESGAVVYMRLEEEEDPTQSDKDVQVIADQMETELVIEKEPSKAVEDIGALSDVERACQKQTVVVDAATYFDDVFKPCARINPCLMLRGNSLLIYGGVTELGDVEITLDDAWSLDLNKRDHWKNVLSGTMRSIEWKGVQDDGDSVSNHTGSVDEEQSDGSDESDNDSQSEDEFERSVAISKKINKTSNIPKQNKNHGVSLKAEMEMLRSHFDITDSFRTPQNGETLREFYSRTSLHWTNEVVVKWNAQEGVLSEKEIKRYAFQLAESRYQELLPLLSRLNELENSQKDEEGRFSRKHRRGDQKAI